MSIQPTPEAFLLAESVPPARLVGHRIWVQDMGAGVVEKFEKAWVGFGTSTHTVRFDNGQVEKVKLRRHQNGKTPFILLTPPSAIQRPAKTVFRYIDEGSESGSEPVTPSEASTGVNIAPIQDTADTTEMVDVAPCSLVEHLEGQAWNNCARIANPQDGFSSSALSESFSESPSYAFSLTPPESARTLAAPAQDNQSSVSADGAVSMDDRGQPSDPMAIPQDGDEDGLGICRVDHLLSESGLIFTPGEHKWIPDGSPPGNDFLSMIREGPPAHAP